MQNQLTRAGYTLPVFACASAIAALHHLTDPHRPQPQVTVDLLDPPKLEQIPIEQVATLPDGAALAITRSDPGDNLDLTRHTPVWAVVRLTPAEAPAGTVEPPPEQRIYLAGGEGIGRIQTADAAAPDSAPAIYAYARRLLHTNLARILPAGHTLQVTLILPAGRALALRTSNAAFGVVEGLSLLGTTGIAQPLSAPGQLDAFRQTLREQAQTHRTLVFCLGENGLDLALQQGIRPECRLKTANWLGPMLVEAALQGVTGILLFGYHGKLIKLAGGIFHTHHHVADGRQEILAALCAQAGLPTEQVQQILARDTTEAGLTRLRQWGQADAVYRAMVERIDQRAERYVQVQCDRTLTVGSILFDRRRQVIVKSANSDALLTHVC
ncbi:MAG: cobalt-precorrin-5B (C(1))-methyltransferase CbiD [Cyanobacteria bacterium P01_A01_bin.105]